MVLRPFLEAPPAPPATIREGGTWKSIIRGSSSDTNTQATRLAGFLGNWSGPTPTITTDHGQSGLRVGLLSEFSEFPDPGGTWSYLLQIHSGEYFLLGKDSRGLSAAITAFCYQNNIHFLNPTTEWTVYPAIIADTIAPTEITPTPISLEFLQGMGNVLTIAGAQTTRYNSWATNNAIISSGLWGYGHAYAAIIASDQTDFNAHPEWVSDTGSKLAVLETGVQTAAINWALTQLSGRKSVSMSAADGSIGWSDSCLDTVAGMNPADRQAYLANIVQNYLDAHSIDCHVAILGYADCSQQFVTLSSLNSKIMNVWATAFVQQGQSPEQVRDNYIAKGSLYHAPYSYVNEWLWYQDAPGGDRFTQRSEIDREYERMTGGTIDAIGWAGEGGPFWAGCGRGYWSWAGLMLGQNPLTRWDNFISYAFPDAITEATALYTSLEQKVPLTSDLLHTISQQATDLINRLVNVSANSNELERSLDLGRYVIYSDYLKSYQSSPSSTTLEPLMQWSYRCRNRDFWNVSTQYQLSTWETDRKAVAAKYHLSDLTINTAPWADTATTQSEILSQLAVVNANNPALPFSPIAYSIDLVRVAASSTFKHASTVRGAFVEETKSALANTIFYHASGADIFSFKGGVVNQSKAAATVRIYEYASGDEIWNETIPNDRVQRDTSPGNGFYPTIDTIAQRLYAIEVTESGAGLVWSWPEGTGVNFILGNASFAPFTGSFSGYFYVPKALTNGKLGFFGNGTIKFFGSDNVQIGSTIAASNNYYSVDIGDNAGEIWKVTGATKLALLTVPPSFALGKETSTTCDLLLPSEVVDADGLTLADATPPPSPTYPPVNFSTDLEAPATPLTGTGSQGFYQYFGHTGLLYYYLADSTSTNFNVKGGIVSTTKGNSVIQVKDSSNTLIYTITAPGDQVARDYTFTTVPGELYTLNLTTLGGSCFVTYANGLKVVGIGQGQNTLTEPRVASYGGWFYVPKGTAQIEWYADGGTMKIYDNTSHLITTQAASKGFYSVAVPTHGDGKLYRFTGITGRFEFLTVPPFYSRRPEEIILPSEVISADNL